MAAKVREAGFENRSIPPASRKALLGGLEEMAEHMREQLPILSKAELVFLKRQEASGE